MGYAVRFEGVSKRYPRGWSEGQEPRYASLRYDLAKLIKRSARRRGPQGTLALQDVTFAVNEGSSFALVGPNGAGKSTALKLVSRISFPTAGEVRVRGRVAALIEVGSGVHPELTGRENIWLYGQILGLSKGEIRKRFDDIVSFAELEHAIDSPVKFFSSGMQLRLGFSIAAHLSPDVFVVDEALAVGDAAFQARCVQRMRALVNEGHTLLFVSHSLPAVRELCDSAALIDGGRIIVEGTSAQILDEYTRRLHDGSVSGSNRLEPIRITRLQVLTDGPSDGLVTGQSVTLILDVESDLDARDVMIDLGLADQSHAFLATFSTQSTGESFDIPKGAARIHCRVPELPFLPGEYELFFEVQATGSGRYVANQSYVGTIVVTRGPDWRASEATYGVVSGRGPVNVPFELKLVDPE
jgi:lipopolysaccharide transport system ATP-binding protein